MLDLVIHKARLADDGRLTDVLITDGTIVDIREPGPGLEAKETIHADEALLSPAFVDCHTHLDKTQVMNAGDAKSIQQSIANFSRYIGKMSSDQLREDVKRRARLTLQKAVAAGTTAMGTHINLEPATDVHAIEAIHELKSEISDFIDVRITVLPSFYDGPEAEKARLEQIRKLAADGMIGAVGGAAHRHSNKIELTRALFEIAVDYDLDVDFHTDEHDGPNIDTFLETIRLTRKYHYEGRVSCSHVTALSRVNDHLAAQAIAEAREAGVHVITLPSCNLYLMARDDPEPKPRGITRIKELLEAGVNVAHASDNIRDPFRPIGNADMLEEGLFTAQVAQMLTDEELQTIHRMGTVNPARAMRLPNYGLETGRQADLVLLDAPDIPSAYRDRARRLAVIKKGRVAARNGILTSHSS